MLWFSDASIMALNLEFSFASRAAGLSNSKICRGIEGGGGGAEWKRAECLLASAQTSGFDYPNCRPRYRNEDMLCHRRIVQVRLFAIGSLCSECKCLERVSSYHLIRYLHLHDTPVWKRGLMISHSCVARR